MSGRGRAGQATGSLAYGIVLGTGILTIVSAPALWLGLACCLAIGHAAWGAVYGVSFGTRRALVLPRDARRARAAPPGAVPMLVLGRRLNPSSRFWLCGVAGGLALTGPALAAHA